MNWRLDFGQIEVVDDAVAGEEIYRGGRKGTQRGNTLN
jgi:hypothetical protein